MSETEKEMKILKRRSAMHRLVLIATIGLSLSLASSAWSKQPGSNHGLSKRGRGRVANKQRPVPQLISNRLSLARELSYGNVKANKKMSPVERSYIQKRQEFETAVIKLVSSAKDTDRKSSTLSIPYSGLMNAKQLYNRLSDSYRYVIKGFTVPMLRVGASKLSRAQKTALRSNVDRWMKEIGLENMSWLFRNNDRQVYPYGTVEIDRGTRDVTRLEMGGFQRYHQKVGVWQ